MYYQKYIYSDNFDESDLLVALKGRQYGRWIDYADKDGTTRDAANGSVADPGYNQNGLIQEPSYIIESILRDEVFVERDLTIDSSASTTTCVISELKSDVDDYYNNAEWFNATTNHRSYVTDYDGGTNTITINDADASMAASDNVFITNIQGDNRININSFDIVGNTTNGNRNGWVFAYSINKLKTANSILAQACYESHCMLFSSYNQYKLVALDTASSGDTWTKSLKQEGREFFDIRLTSLQNIFTSFKLNYSYDYGEQNYQKYFFVNKNGYTSGGSVISSTEQDLCEAAETNYKIKNNFEYSSDWIYDLTTAEKLLQKLVLWFTKQRMVVTWTTPLSDGSIDYIKYELGDQVVLSNTRILPTGISGVKCFMITGKQIIIKRGDPYIVWNLIEMEDLPT